MKNYTVMPICCPVCSEEVDPFDICDHCGYQNMGSVETETDVCGPNKMSLKQAKAAYREGKRNEN